MTNYQYSTPGEEALRRLLTALAWNVILILTAPQIIYRLFVTLRPGEHVSPIWLALIQVGVLGVLIVLTWVWPILKPLRGFLLALFALWVGLFFILPFIRDNVAWSNWKQSVSWGIAQVAARLEVHLVLTGLMALTLIGSGIGRRELFLVRGNLSAPASPAHFIQGNRFMPWNKVVIGWLPYYIFFFLGIELIMVRPDMSKIPQALSYLPAIIIMAAINAFGEEFQFRSMVLARLEAVLGSQQAIPIAAGLFGLMHYFGVPGTLPGVLLAGYLGWVTAKSMIETRSIVWAFLIHFIGDFLLYIIWAMII
jgi:membrane protease YdiL (CAAX protease family)